MLEWFVLLALVAGITSLLGYATIAAGVAALGKLMLLITAIAGIGLLCAALLQVAQNRKRRIHGSSFRGHTNPYIGH
jgi:hypothetical protein